MLQSIGSVFKLRYAPSKRIMVGLVLLHLGLALTLWSTSSMGTLPKPGEVAHALRTLWFMQGLAHELWTSVALNMQAILLTVLISLPLTYLSVFPVFRPLVVAISKGRFLGLIGLTFVFTLFFGGGRPLKVALLVFGMTVFFVTSMASVVAEIPEAKFDHARTLGMSTPRLVWEIVILGTLDQAIEVLRQNAAIGWMMLTMVEGISRSEGGLGALLLNQNKHFHLAEVFAVQLLILTLGLLQDAALGALKRLFCPWAEIGKGN